MKTLLVGVLATVLAVGLSQSRTNAADGTKAGEACGADKKTAVKAITGQCHCGLVKYTAQGPILNHSYCDCRGCQRATGTLKAPFITVHKASFKVTAGELAKFRAKSGVKCDAHGEWAFCQKCGTQLVWIGDKGGKVDIFAGTLDKPAVFKPEG